MRAGLYCFSPTGTSRAVGELLCARFPQCLLVDITSPSARAEPVCRVEVDLFCLVVPVYAHGIPDEVRRWLKALPEWHGPACVICTYGSAGSGSAVYDAVHILKAKGAVVLGAAELPGPHSYDCGETPYTLHAEKNWTGLETFFEAVLEKAKDGSASILPPHRPDPVRYFPQSWSGKLAVLYPKIDRAQCTGCNVCKAVCPVGAAGEKTSRCIRCAACVRNCPRGARRWCFRTILTPLYISSQIKKKRPPRFIL